MNAWNIEQGPKQKIRETLAKALPEINKILTLPSKEGLCVKTFKHYHPQATIIGIERDKEVFQEAQKHNINMYNCSIKEYVKGTILPQTHCDLIFLDYVGFLSGSIIEDLKILLKNDNLVHKGKKTVIGLTLQKSIRKGRESLARLANNFMWVDEDSEIENNYGTVYQILDGILSNLNINFKLFGEEYKASQNTASMYFFMIEIEK